VPSAAPAGRDPQPVPQAQPTDEADVGANAFLYLNARVPKLVIEVDAVEGFAPSDDALDLLRTRLAAVTDKPRGIVVTKTQTIPGQADGVWTEADLRASARRHRDRTSTASEATMYLQFVDGRFEQAGAFGVTYSASQAAMFVGHMRDAATLVVGASSLQRATLIHEIGHLLSLVNLGYESPRAREDPEHPGHSSNPDSVMYWAVDNVGILRLLSGRAEPPTAFDDADLADLADVRKGALGR
jgi:hypothetical protein